LNLGSLLLKQTEHQSAHLGDVCRARRIRRIIRSLLEEVSVALIFQPARPHVNAELLFGDLELSGDFYDIFQRDDMRLSLSVCFLFRVEEESPVTYARLWLVDQPTAQYRGIFNTERALRSGESVRNAIDEQSIAARLEEQ
jgi:hypothetical protein